jgi:GH15 family glucan-1,4-alpha-glucosidase
MHDAGCISVSAERFRVERDAIRAQIETRGYSEGLESYVSIFDGEDLDASLLTLPLYGYVDAAHPRMRSTSARIRAQLGQHDLVYRYLGTDDGLPPGEGAFGIASFWAAECLARGGDIDAATATFERLLAHANDVGLYGEEIAPDTGAPLGNFPQAFTHVGLINAALTLAECHNGPARSDEDVQRPAAEREAPR